MLYIAMLSILFAASANSLAYVRNKGEIFYRIKSLNIRIYRG